MTYLFYYENGELSLTRRRRIEGQVEVEKHIRGAVVDRYCSRVETFHRKRPKFISCALLRWIVGDAAVKRLAWLQARLWLYARR